MMSEIVKDFIVCPECGEKIDKKTSTIVHDYEVDSKNHEKLLSESYIFKCEKTKKLIWVIISYEC